MKYSTKILIALFAFLTVTISCDKDDDLREPLPSDIDFSKVEVEDFIWQGLNFWYFWKDNVSNLDDSKIEDGQEYYNLLTSEDSPEAFFESLLYLPFSVDVYSWIVDDYVALENSFKGEGKTTGARYGFVYETDSNFDIYGYVRYVLPDSDAELKNVKRGDVFDAVDGVQLTVENYRDLISSDTYTLNFAEFNDGNPLSTGESVELTQVETVENPVYIAKTVEESGTKIAYLMFNGFDAGFEEELDDAFAQFKTDGATELVLDLRYNGGGYDYVSMQLATSIAGQFPGEIVKTDQYNADIQQYFKDNAPENLVSRFATKVQNLKGETLRETINSLNLTNLYVLVSGSTASASEVVISGLSPYINVQTIGTTTYGKYTGSATFYDSDNFRKDGNNLNENHKYAMQPIILRYANINNEDVQGGIEPTVPLSNPISHFGELGDPNEPLFAKAIELITGVAKESLNKKIENNAFEMNVVPNTNKFENDLIITTPLPIDLIRK